MVKSAFNLSLDVLLTRIGRARRRASFFFGGGVVGEERSRFINVELALCLIAAGFINME